MTDFLPKDYKVPVTGGNYMKLQDGNNEFRILSTALIGFGYWNTDNKPVRSTTMWESVPEDIKLDIKGNPTSIKHFWAFTVWNYASKSIQILEITQSTIQGAIEALVRNPKWGNPKDYDISVTRKGSGLETEYSVVPNPKQEIEADILAQFKEKNPNLEALLSGQDPFGSKGKVTETGMPKDIEPEDIPF